MAACALIVALVAVGGFVFGRFWEQRRSETRRIDCRVSVLASEPNPTYLVEPFAENAKRVMVKQGRAVVIDKSARVIGWTRYNNGEIVDSGPHDPKKPFIVD
jgi:hypothetical protein